jgi:MarR family 2-MHQ and catechol resistance regulon transcriptional repressor
MPTRHQGTPEESRALDAYVKLVRASDAVSDRIHRHLAETGLSTSQFGVLEALLHLGPLCQKDLGEKILKSGGNVTFVVRNLERRRLVRRERPAENRRFVSVALTEEGRRLIKRIFPRHVAEVVAAMGALPAADLEALSALLRRLGLAAESAGE